MKKKDHLAEKDIMVILHEQKSEVIPMLNLLALEFGI
jgi:hypothetical protein